ncbi:hypothetical protein AB0D08_11495 [Kitasatospora sp. NPDC048540]|uniref:hypothetical protein n=1 Tax=unclassified Kitasatospora TaxID=2633591 RepID=UPI0011EA6D15|nr:hypothetical protein [Kitasatospora sp. MBT63]
MDIAKYVKKFDTAVKDNDYPLAIHWLKEIAGDNDLMAQIQSQPELARIFSWNVAMRYASKEDFKTANKWLTWGGWTKETVSEQPPENQGGTHMTSDEIALLFPAAEK